MKKIIRPEGPAKKIILLRFCPKKIPEQKVCEQHTFYHGPQTFQSGVRSQDVAVEARLKFMFKD